MGEFGNINEFNKYYKNIISFNLHQVEIIWKLYVLIEENLTHLFMLH